MRRTLRAVARRQHRPAAEIVRDSLRRYMALEQFADLRRRIVPQFEAQGLLTDEDVFKALE
jgi:hypothetical protein